MLKMSKPQKKRRTLIYMYRDLTITKRITLLYGGLFSLSLLVLSIWFCCNVTASEENDIRQQLEATLLNIEDHIDRNGVLNHDTLQSLLDNEYIRANVYDDAEKKSYSSHGKDMPMFIHQLGPDRMRSIDASILLPSILEEETKKDAYSVSEEVPLVSEDDLYIHTCRENGNKYREFILEEVNNQRIMLLSKVYRVNGNTYHIQAYRLLSGNQFFIKVLVGKTIVADLIGVLAAFLVGRYISRRVLQPVERIRMAAERISIEDLSQRIDLDEPDDEMRELSVTFNSMIDRLEKAFDKQNQFVSDASHELRTPISIIQGYANLINRWGKNNPGVLEESIESILSETEHMNTLIENLLFLAKSDRKCIPVQIKQLYLNDLVKEVAREVEFFKGNRTIEYTESGVIPILGDEDLLKQLLWIYIDNALKYTAEDGNISLRVWKDKEYAYVAIEDNGAGIAKEDKDRIFDRFYREDKSRNKEISGTGLGLSIAKRIVDFHKGQVEVQSEQGKGTCFITRFALLNRSSKDLKKQE